MKKIWIDLDNAPHVPFFSPIVAELETCGYAVMLTTRDAYQVRALAEYHGLKHTTIGRHYGANKLLKIVGTIWRSAQLLGTVLRYRPDVSLSHGSRPLTLVSAALRIPTILLFDYEYARRLPFIKPALGMTPEAIDSVPLAGQFKLGVRKYPGLKEDIYASGFRPDAAICQQLQLRDRDVVVTVRPPATEAHYHNRESERLFIEVVEYLAVSEDVVMILLPRTTSQREVVEGRWANLCASGKLRIPTQVVDGLNLVWHSDLVVSGGGTMNREAAALGVPVYSIFRGPIGAVDRYLERTGRLTLIEKVEDVRAKIRLVRREKDSSFAAEKRQGLAAIVDATRELAGETARGIVVEGV